MHLEGYEDVFFIVTYGVAIVMLSSLAAWKNRSPLAWGLIGGLRLADHAAEVLSASQVYASASPMHVHLLRHGSRAA